MHTGSAISPPPPPSVSSLTFVNRETKLQMNTLVCYLFANALEMTLLTDSSLGEHTDLSPMAAITCSLRLEVDQVS